MLLAHQEPIPVPASLSVIMGILGVGILASVAFPESSVQPTRAPVEEELAGLQHVTVVGARQAVVLVLGGSLLVLGVFLLVLPGPGILTIVLGLVLVGSQLLWARCLIRRVLQLHGNGKCRPAASILSPCGTDLACWGW